MLSKVISMLEGIRNKRKKVYLAIAIGAVLLCAVGAGISFGVFGLLTIARDFAFYVLPFFVTVPSLFVAAASNKHVINGARKWEAALTARRTRGVTGRRRVSEEAEEVVEEVVEFDEEDAEEVEEIVEFDEEDAEEVEEIVEVDEEVTEEEVVEEGIDVTRRRGR